MDAIITVFTDQMVVPIRDQREEVQVGRPFFLRKLRYPHIRTHDLWSGMGNPYAGVLLQL